MSIAILIILLASLLVIIGGIFLSVGAYRKSARASQRIISDRDLLLLINEEPDRIINTTSIAKKTGLSINQARNRMTKFMYAGTVNQITSGLKYFYELKVPIAEEGLIELSNNPFISIEDLFTLFDHFGQKMTIQNICIATGLPYKVIKEEMKYFKKEGIVYEMTSHKGIGLMADKFYTLQEAYKGNRDNHMQRDSEINLDLKEIYTRLNKDGDGYV